MIRGASKCSERCSDLAVAVHAHLRYGYLWGLFAQLLRLPKDSEFRTVSLSFRSPRLQQMPNNAPTSADGPRTMRRRSLLRRAWCDVDLPVELAEVMLRGDPDRVLFTSNPLQVKD